MSIYIRVERYTADPKFLQTRALHTVIGENAQGLLTCEAPLHPWFSLYATDPTPTIQFASDALRYNTKVVPQGFQTALACGDTLEGHDYRFHFYTTLPQAEIFAYSDLAWSDLRSKTDLLGRVPSLTVQLANLVKTAPLYQNLPVTLGSHENDAVFLNLLGVHARHCSFTNTDRGVLVKPLEGQISYNGEDVIDAVLLKEDCFVALEPIGLGVTVTFPTAPY
ncbi:hypothetical protein OAO01_06125 [Oligoflexia bacterium]|nr:hypothetical protein [Oligoflexia bacterium]